MPSEGASTCQKCLLYMPALSRGDKSPGSARAIVSATFHCNGDVKQGGAGLRADNIPVAMQALRGVARTRRIDPFDLCL